MSQVKFIGDLHLGHAGAIRFRDEFRTIEEHDDFICGRWEATVQKNDIVYVCGDAAFTTEGIERIVKLPGRKFLVRGNHDVFSASRYLLAFEDIGGIVPYRCSLGKFWVTHAPIHPDELRNRPNIHGHVHKNTIRKDGDIDKRYYNVSAENIDYEPRTVDWLVAHLHPRA